MKSDVITQVQFEQLTCNLDNKYYNALKDKCNLVAMCYFEHVIDNVEEKKNAFTKKMEQVGELVDRKSVMVFADHDNAVDCKSHFEYIPHKIDFSAEGFVKAVEDAIAMKIDTFNGKMPKKSEVKTSKLESVDEITAPEPEVEDDIDIDVDLDEELIVDLTEIRTEIRNKNKAGSAEQKAAVKAIIKETGKKLDEIEDIEILNKMLEIFK